MSINQMTVSMTWMTPLVAMMSGWMTVASPPSDTTEMVAFVPGLPVT